MKRIWLTTDTHFGHRKMEEYCGRPSNFEQLIWTKLNQNVKHDDLLIHLGDVCIGDDDYWNTWFTHSLPAKKWLIRGNHDKKSILWYLAHGWDFVGDAITGTFFGQEILFSHIPAPEGTYTTNIHGHLHNSDHHPEVTPHPKNKLLALEHTKYSPVLLEKFIQKEPKKVV